MLHYCIIYYRIVSYRSGISITITMIDYDYDEYEWRRGRRGTVESVNDIDKNDK